MAKVKQFEISEVISYKGRLYEVLDKNKVGKDFHYSVSCSECSEKFPDVFGRDNPLTLKWGFNARSSFEKETLILCPCDKGYKWNRESHTRLITSFKNPIVSLVSLGEYKGNLTHCTVNCRLHGELTTTIKTYLSGGGCKVCSSKKCADRRSKQRVFEDLFKEQLLDYQGWDGVSSRYKTLCGCGNIYYPRASSLLEGRRCRSCGNNGIKDITKSRVGVSIGNYEILGLSPEKTRDVKYVVRCGTCYKNDPELWYDGSCTSNWGNLKKGQHCCGCSATPIYTQDQIDILINRYFNGSSYTYKGRSSGGLSSCRIYSSCSKGHDYESNYHNLLKGHGCKVCFLEEVCDFGLYKDRLEEQDTLYLVELDGFLKVGRSFQLKERLRTYRRVFSTVKLVTTYTSPHQHIYNTEQCILSKYKAFKYYPDKYFGGYSECFTLSSLNELRDFIYELGSTEETES